jgi:heme/copper-type cytochrome/quinol oxidase subunit 2
MTVVIIIVIGVAIAMTFYYINRESAQKEEGGVSRLQHSTAMVFTLSTAVLLMAYYFGLGKASGQNTPSNGTKLQYDNSHNIDVYKHIIDGDPPF